MSVGIIALNPCQGEVSLSNGSNNTTIPDFITWKSPMQAVGVLFGWNNVLMMLILEEKIKDFCHPLQKMGLFVL